MPIAPGAALGERYEALELIGRGGMGEVWRCRDVARDEDVAVKVVPEDELDDRAARRFLDEVLVTARLDHPRIARVYDLIDHAGGVALVLELCEGSPLSRIRMTVDELLEVAAQVLDALAYAHARGVLHLDVKPANVLAARGADGMDSTLLDFGIARAWRREAAEHAPGEVLGTFAYMAPEQLLSNVTRLGPWTDLFGLGATLYHLAAGVAPFAEQPLEERGLIPPPRLDAIRPELPVELADVLARLLGAREEERPTHAADVAHALRAVPSSAVALPVRPTRSSGPTQDTDEITSPAPIRTTGPWTGATTAPVPVSAVLPEWTERPQPEPGAYGLFGLRELPPIGRADERARIWESLLEVRKTGEARLIAIRGASGLGKSRLAQDLVERAHEVGLAHTAQTAWTEGGSPDDPIRRLVAHALGVHGVDGIELTAAAHAWAARFGEPDPRLLQDLRQLLDSAAGRGDADLPLRTCVEVARRQAAARAAVIWLDDVQHGGLLARALVKRLRALEAPVAVIVTCGESTELGAAPDLELAVQALGHADIRALVLGHVGVTDELADALAEAADGDPRLASAMLSHLVEERALVREGDRWGLREADALTALPRDLPSLWDRRVTRAGLDTRLLAALALVRPLPREQTLERLGEELGADLLAVAREAARAGLLRLREGAYEWVEPGMRTHVSGRLPAEERAPLHAAAAVALASRVGRDDVQAERARHLWAAGADDDGSVAMADAIVTAVHRADHALARARARELAERAEEGSAAHARAMAELAHLLAMDGEHDAAREHLANATTEEPSAWVELRRSQVATLGGDEDTARAAARDALELSREHGPLDVELHATAILAVAARRRGERDEAGTLFERVTELAAELGDGATQARALMHLGNLAPASSLEVLERSVTVAVAAGARREELMSRQVYADALYLVGLHEQAAEQMQTVGAQARAIGFRQMRSIASIQLGCWALRERDGARAAGHAADSAAAGAREGSRVERCMVAAIEAAAQALQGEAEAAARSLATLAEARGDYDEEELREVLTIGRDASSGALRGAFDAALT